MARDGRRNINIVFRSNGQGLSRDARLLRRILSSAGHAVTLTAQSPIEPPLKLRFAPELATDVIRRVRNGGALLARRLFEGRRWDINVFLECIDKEYLPFARHNWFLPNPEWLSDEDRRLMQSLDLILFKTRHAQQRLAANARTSVFVGFTSEDRFMPGIARNWNRALLVGGWNPFKGVAATLSAWAAQPGWPHLTTVAQTDRIATAPNIQLLARRVRDARLRRLQNACGVHLCPSEVEGFGHTINEARSCGSLTITTDAPPMNELITPETGLLVPYRDVMSMATGTRYIVTASGLAEAMERLARLTLSERERCGAAARSSYEAGRSRFAARLLELAASV